MSVRVHSTHYFSGHGVFGAFRAARWIVSIPRHPSLNPEDLFALVPERFPEGAAVMASNPVPETMGALFLQLALAVQRTHHQPVSRGAVRLLAGGDWEVVVEVVRESIVAPLAECVGALVDEIAGWAPRGSFHQRLEARQAVLKFELTDVFLHDRRIVARRLGVPVWYDGARRQFFGDGAHARLVSPGKTSLTTRLGSDLTGDKERTYRRLAACGLPVPRQIAVESVEDAIAAARRIGWPVVLKPRWGKQGRGVTVNLGSDDAVRAAWEAASEFGNKIVVERYVQGTDYRLLVIGGRFVAAVGRIPARVCGDGQRTIRELIDASNRTDRRDGVFLWPLHLDAEMLGTLAAQGLSPDDVPREGKDVALRRVANQSIGGTTVDVTDLVHPDNRELAVAVAKACLLDLAGIDLVTTDVSRSWREGVGAVIEVNSGPGIDLHMLPTEGKPRDVSRHLVRSVHPARSPGLVPRFLVAGEGGEGVARSLSARLEQSGHCTGRLCGNEAAVDGRVFTEPGAQRAAELLFSLPDVDAVVVEQSLKALAGEGSMVERYAVGVLTDAGGDTSVLEEVLLDGSAAERVLDMVVWLSSVVVIDAAQARLRAHTSRLAATQVGWVWSEAGAPAGLAAHLEAGGFAVGFEDAAADPALVLRVGTQRTVLGRYELGGARVREDAFAAAALVGAGMAAEAVAALLRGERGARVPTLAERARGEVPAALWSRDALEQAFDGAWIQRPGPGWRAGPLVCGLERVEAGAVAVIDGPADELEAVAGLEAAVREAFERGASAVVAPLLPDDLPRWHPVLVCDAPQAGFESARKTVTSSCRSE